MAFVPTDTIDPKASILIGALDYTFSNVALANANTSLAKAFSFTGFTTYPISSVSVLNQGGGLSATPIITKFLGMPNRVGQMQIGQSIQATQLIFLIAGSCLFHLATKIASDLARHTFEMMVIPEPHWRG